MKRRAFITLLGGAATWPFVGRAQQTRRTYRLGFMVPAGRESSGVIAFFDELRLLGFIEGQNVDVIPGGFDIRNDQLAERAATVVAAAPDAIVSGPDLYAQALQQATRTVPIITMTEDILAGGLVASLSRPGGNTTGISLLARELDGKRQEILMEAVPSASRMAALADATVTPPQHLQMLKDAAQARGIELSIFGVGRAEEIVAAIDVIKSSGAGALNILATPLFAVPGGQNSRVVIERVAALSLPAIYQWPETAEDGGFAGYGPSFIRVYRQRARIVVKILLGSRPADIPVEQPTHFELVINLKTAKAIGVEVPAGLLLRADKVIE